MHVSAPRPDLFLVRYDTDEDLLPERQAELVERLRVIGAQQPVAVVFDVADAIRSVDIGVPGFWLGVTGERSIALRAMAIASRSRAVRVAAGGFRLANQARGLPIQVQVFDTADAGVEWAGGVLDQARAAAP